MVATDSTNKLIIVIGASKLSSGKLCSMFPTMNTIKIMYTNAESACKNGFFIFLL